MFIIPKPSLRPMRGYLLAVPLLNLLLLGGVFWVHAETKARLSGALVSSSIHLPKTKASHMYSVDKIIIALKVAAPVKALAEEGDKALQGGDLARAADAFARPRFLRPGHHRLRLQRCRLIAPAEFRQ